MKKLLQRIYRLLWPGERKKSVKVTGAVCLCALLDFAGLAALLPVLFFFLEDTPPRGEMWGLGLCAVGFILLKNIGVLYLSRYQYKFLLSVYERLSRALFASYYQKGFLFIRQEGSMKLGYEVNYACYAFCLNVAAPFLRMAAECLLIGMVTVACLFYSPLAVGIVYGVFLPVTGVFVWRTKRYVRMYGERELEVRKEQSRLVQDTFRGYAEWEVGAAFPFLCRTFAQGVHKISACRLNMETAQRLPAGLLEISVVVGLTGLLLCGGDDRDYLLGAFGVIAFRLLPALRTILSCWTSIQNSAPCLDVLEQGLEDSAVEEEKAVGTFPFEHTMEVRGLTFAYPGRKELLCRFSCSVEKGEYVGISGFSGIGKSTLFYLLLGILSPLSGEIRIDGRLLTASTRAAWLRRVGYVAQQVFIVKGTLAENIALGERTMKREQIKKVLQEVELGAWLESLPQGIDTALGEDGATLSGGQRQRIGIARALYKGADVLLLDEATSALDSDTERSVNEMLRSLKDENGVPLTLLCITHRERSLAYCDRIINMEKDE